MGTQNLRSVANRNNFSWPLVSMNLGFECLSTLRESKITGLGRDFKKHGHSKAIL